MSLKMSDLSSLFLRLEYNKHLWRLHGRRNVYDRRRNICVSESKFWGYIRHLVLETPAYSDATWLYRFSGPNLGTMAACGISPIMPSKSGTLLQVPNRLHTGRRYRACFVHDCYLPDVPEHCASILSGCKVVRHLRPGAQSCLFRHRRQGCNSICGADGRKKAFKVSVVFFVVTTPLHLFNPIILVEEVISMYERPVTEGEIFVPQDILE